MIVSLKKVITVRMHVNSCAKVANALTFELPSSQRQFLFFYRQDMSLK